MLRDIDSVLEIEYEPKSVVDLACNSRTLRLYKHGTGGCHDHAVQTLRYLFSHGIELGHLLHPSTPAKNFLAAALR
jgi:hypothetical protein